MWHVWLTACNSQYVLEGASQLHPRDVSGAVTPEARGGQQRLNTSCYTLILHAETLQPTREAAMGSEFGVVGLLKCAALDAGAKKG